MIEYSTWRAGSRCRIIAEAGGMRSADGAARRPERRHSSLVYLVDAAGKYVGYFPPGTAAERMVEVMRQQLAVVVQR